MIVLSYKYRIYPTKNQQQHLNMMLADFCDLYNAGLQQRIEAYQRQKVSLTYVKQASELKACRQDEALSRWSYTAEQQVLRRLEKSFKAFFHRLKAGETPGFPRFKSKTRFDSAEFRVGDGLTIRKSSKIGIVGIPDEIKVKWHRELPSKPTAAVITRKNGKWYICFQLELPAPEKVEREFSAVGIDPGLSSLVAMSTGEVIDAPKFYRKSQAELRRVQRAVDRKEKGSNRQKKARLQVAKLYEKVANQRRDFSHKLSRTIVNEFTLIALEDPNILGLSRGKLAKSQHDAAWGQLYSHLTYKAEEAGSVIEWIDPRYTSQTCPSCGFIRKKTLAERTHTCLCGSSLDRDVAAAQVILQKAKWFGRNQQASRQNSGSYLACEAVCFS